MFIAVLDQILFDKLNFLSDMKDFYRRKISRRKIPGYVFFVKEYPMTASGEIHKFKLQRHRTP